MALLLGLEAIENYFKKRFDELMIFWDSFWHHFKTSEFDLALTTYKDQ